MSEKKKDWFESFFSKGIGQYNFLEFLFFWFLNSIIGSIAFYLIKSKIEGRW